MYNMELLDKVIKDTIKDYKPFIEYIGDGLYMVNAGRYSCVCNLAGAKEFDAALRKAAADYTYKD